MFKILCSSFILFLSFESIKSQQCAVPQISSLIASALTPFKANLEVNVDIIPQYAQYLKDNGILDVLIAGYIGEGPSLNLCDRKALIQAWVDAALPLGIGVLVQIGILPYPDILELAEFCVELNVKAIVVLPEVIYQAQTVDEAIADLKLIANVAVGIPILFEDIPAVQGIVSPVDIYILAVAEIPCFVGIITSINTALNIKAVTSIADKLICIAGSEAIAPALSLQFSASVCAAVNLFPLLALDIKAAIDAGNLNLAEDLQEELNLKIAACINLDGGSIDVYARAFIINQKVALSLIAGLDIALTRLPLVPAVLDLVNKIADALTELAVPLVGAVEDVLSWIL